MTHLPYIIAAYGITLFTLFSVWIYAWIRLKHVKNKLENLKKIQS